MRQAAPRPRRHRPDAGRARIGLHWFIQAREWPPLLTWSAIATGLLLAVSYVAHAVRHPAPVVSPRLFTVRRSSASAVGLVTYYVGFSILLLSTTLLLTEHLHLSVLDAPLATSPAPIISGICSPLAGRLAARITARSTIVAGAGLFAMSAAWPLVSAGETPSDVASILPGILLWGEANALLKPTFYAAADAAPPANLASASAVLTMARQLGAAVGVALLVVVLGDENAMNLTAFQHAWSSVIVAATVTGAAGFFSVDNSQVTPAPGVHLNGPELLRVRREVAPSGR